MSENEKTPPTRDDNAPMLPRNATWEEWERGRWARRATSNKITGGRELRRKAGDPEKDALLRKLNNGARGMPFAKLEPPGDTETPR